MLGVVLVGFILVNVLLNFLMVFLFFLLEVLKYGLLRFLGRNVIVRLLDLLLLLDLELFDLLLVLV